MRRSIFAIAAVSVAALAAPPSNAATTVLPPGSTVAGQSIADWTEGWWTRYWQYPFALIDPTTGNIPATLNNGGPVFYAPTTDGDPSLGHITINFSVPAGRPIPGLFNALFFVGLRFSESELQHFPTNRPGIAVLGIPPTRIAMTPCRATFTVAGGLPCRRSLRLSLCWPKSTIQDVPKARCIGYLTSCCLRS